MTVETFLYLIPILLASLTLHELAHAYVAWRLGDPTAKEQGRLTLNPLKHLDPLGTATFAITAWIGDFIFGWAKPVAVQPGYFRRPKEGMALVAAAGPASNFVLALACVAALVHLDLGEQASTVLERGFFVNVILGIFNLVPVPPLDGSRIVAVVLSDAMYARWAELDRFGMLGILALIFLFRDEFWTVLGEALEQVARFMVTVVGG